MGSANSHFGARLDVSSRGDNKRACQPTNANALVGGRFSWQLNSRRMETDAWIRREDTPVSILVNRRGVERAFIRSGIIIEARVAKRVKL